MAEKRYYWLKMNDDFFDQKEIKKLRRIAGGDTYTIIYLKMLLLSLKDEGKLFFDGIEETFVEELALAMDEDVDNVKVTVSYLMSVGLLNEVNAVEAELTAMPSLIGGETSAAQRMRKHRAKQGNNIVKKLPAKTDAERQQAYRAKKIVQDDPHVPYIEDYQNKKRYGGNYYIVFKRDERKCVICGSQENLCVHHIDGYDENNQHTCTANRMVTLCRKCHKNVHDNNITISSEILENIGYSPLQHGECNEHGYDDVTSMLRHGYTDIDIDIEKEKEKKFREDVKEIVSYLNEMVGTNYKSSSGYIRTLIHARIEDGFTVEDFKTVIYKKTKEWIGTEQQKYLRPQTLFGTKFESYLNQLDAPASQPNGADDMNSFYEMMEDWASDE